ncbi:unnamed protein product [Prorocentrum cordatum]|uniref:Uncharacterized protein n=1 Tax=Prorocentrum cordatum TaxID=2364126 RepID=A0ABN9RYC7_9DINO|nr:unnamed protein product [Polarella glacialis]
MIINSMRRLAATGLNGAIFSEALVPFLWHRDIKVGSTSEVTGNASQYERECDAVGMAPSWEQHRGLQGKILGVNFEKRIAELASAVGNVHVPIRALRQFSKWQPRRLTVAAVSALGYFINDEFADSDGIKRALDNVFTKHMRHISDHEQEFRHLVTSSRDTSVRVGARALVLFSEMARRRTISFKAKLKSVTLRVLQDERRFKDKERKKEKAIVKKKEMESQIGLNMSSQVQKPIFFDNDDVLRVPPGMMVLLTAHNEVEAHRCPNIHACPGVTLAAEELLSPSSTFFNRSCEEGYRPDLPGCAGCAPGSGRSPMDVFACKACGDRSKEALLYISLPLSLFLFGLKSAYDPSEAECFGSVLTVFLSFHSAASLVLGAIVASPIGSMMPKDASLFLSFCIASAEEASGMPSGSIDCFLERPAGVTSWLLHSAVVPVTILMLWVGGAVALGCIRGVRPNYTVIVVRPAAVFVKSFLPMIFAGVWRAWPCFHTQAGSGLEYYTMIYDVSAVCPVLGKWPPDPSAVLCPCGALLCCLLGPGLWGRYIPSEHHHAPRGLGRGAARSASGSSEPAVQGRARVLGGRHAGAEDVAGVGRGLVPHVLLGGHAPESGGHDQCLGFGRARQGVALQEGDHGGHAALPQHEQH